MTKSPLKIGAKQKPKKTVIADSFLQEVQRNRESDLLQINSGPRTRSSQKTSQPKQVSLSELEIDLLKDLVKEPSSVVEYVQSKKLITEKHLKQDPHSLSDEFLTNGVADFMCVEKFFTEDGYRAALLLYEKKVKSKYLS